MTIWLQLKFGNHLFLRSLDLSFLPPVGMEIRYYAEELPLGLPSPLKVTGLVYDVKQDCFIVRVEAASDSVAEVIVGDGQWKKGRLVP